MKLRRMYGRPAPAYLQQRSGAVLRKAVPSPCNGAYAWTRACIWVRLEVPLESLRYQSPSSRVDCIYSSRPERTRICVRRLQPGARLQGPGPGPCPAHACIGRARPGQQRRGGRPGWQLPGPPASVIVVTA